MTLLSVLLPVVQVLSMAAEAMPINCRDQIKSKLKGRSPTNSFILESGTAVCQAEQMKSVIAKSREVCPKNTSKMRIACFQEWSNKQDIAYAAQVAQLSVVAVGLANEDKANQDVNSRAVLPVLLDTTLSLLERYSTSKNVAYLKHSKDMQEWALLREQEDELFALSKIKILQLVQAKIAELKRVPVTMDATGQWLTKAISHLETRASKIR